jgi:hypothetical protein
MRSGRLFKLFHMRDTGDDSGEQGCAQYGDEAEQKDRREPAAALQLRFFGACSTGVSVGVCMVWISEWWRFRGRSGS